MPRPVPPIFPPKGPLQKGPGIFQPKGPQRTVAVVDTGTAVALGGDGAFQHNNTLTPTDPRLPISSRLGNKQYKLYTLPMEQGKTYQIHMASNQFDSYLILLNPRNQFLVSDDDGGGNLNAHILYTATESGTFKVLATSLGGSVQGNFTLTVRRQGP
jgi:hypothetical protein